MSGSNKFNFSLNGTASASNSTTDQEVGNTTPLIDDCRKNNYTSPQENFKYTETFKKPSVDMEHEVNEVWKEEITKLSGHIQGGEQKK